MTDTDNQPPKYHTEVNQTKGLVIGDNAHFEQHIHEAIQPPMPATRDDLLVAIEEANAELRGFPHKIADEHLERVEVTEIVEWILEADPKEKLGIVLDQPGSGKTVIMRDVLVRLEDAKVPVLAIKADFLSGIKTADDLAGRLRLPAPVEACARHLATDGLFVVLLDQLDALSLSLSRDQATLDVMLSTLARLRNLDNVRIVASCRTFDLNNDPRLSQVEVDKKFKLQPLSNDQIDRVLQAIGVDPGRLLPAHRTVLATPLHLDVYARVFGADSSGQPPESFHTLQELYEALWRQRIAAVPPNSPPPDERIAAIYRLVEAMQSSRQIAVPVGILDDYPRSANYLEGINFIRREGRNYLFFHQTLFDYCYARRFIAQGRSLSREILDGPQGLFERSQMVQVLAYLRGADDTIYRSELDSLLFSDRLRVHLKLLLIGWFGSLPNPTSAEWQIARRFTQVDENRHRFFQAVSGNSGWFKHVKVIIPTMLSSDKEQDVNLAAGLLTSLVSQETEATLTYLKPYLGRSEAWDERIAYCLSNLKSWHSEKAVAMVCDLFHRRRTFHYESSFLYNLRANPAVGCRVLRIYLDHRLEELLAHEAAGTQPEQINAHGIRVRISDRSTWGDYLLGEHALNELIEQASQKCPDQILQHLLPWFRRAAETLSEPRQDTDYPRDPIFAAFWYGDHLLEGATFARQMAKTLSYTAQTDPATFRELANGLAQAESLAVQRVLINAYLTNPKAYAEEIYTYLVTDGRRLNIGEPLESSHYDSRRLFAAVFPYLTAERRTYLEQMILDLKPEWELRHGRSFGITQLQFLKGIPLDLLSDAGQRKRTELQHKFPDFQLYRPQGVTGGWVGPPITQPAQEKMSDEAWLGAMHKYDDASGWGERNRDLLKGGVIQLSRSFEEQVKKEPERFYKLAQRFDDMISLHYVSAAISGLAESEVPAEWVLDLTRHFADRFEGEFRRYVCRALSKRAEDDVPDDLLDLLSDWALHDPDPQQELWRVTADREQAYYGGDPYDHGINTNRGAAIQTVGQCAFKRKPPQYERVFALLEEMAANDPSTAVRSCIVSVLGPLLNQDSERTLTIFEQAIADHPVLLSTIPVRRFLDWVYRKHFDRIRPYVETLLNHSEDSLRHEGARLACLAAFFHPEANDLAKLALGGDAAMRRGAAQVYARYLAVADVSDICRQHLLLLMHDPEEEVREQVGWCFTYLQPEQLEELRPFIEAFLDSPALFSGARHLIEFLKPLAADEQELAIRVTTHILDMTEADLVDSRRSIVMLERDLVSLPLTVYTHAPDLETQSQAMALFERLLLLNSQAAKQALADWDRR